MRDNKDYIITLKDAVVGDEFLKDLTEKSLKDKEITKNIMRVILKPQGKSQRRIYQ